MFTITNEKEVQPVGCVLPNTLVHGDCLEVMKYIPSGSIDLVLCDPPYGWISTTKCKWDSIIPLEPMWGHLKRIIKPNGAIVLFGAEPFSSTLRVSNISQYKYDWVWEKSKSSGHLNAKFQPMKKHEFIHVFSKSASTYSKKGNMKYNPQGLRDVNILQKRKGKVSETHNTCPNNETIQAKSGYPTSVIKFKVDSGLHPTQKPVALMEYLIKTYTNEGETVVDFTFGSGTTGVACVNTNRNFIGIELDEDYFNTAVKRIKEL